ncbi:hypothetical protein TELCIR_15653 [Teladorsagia circumcincta]|uniref:Uncharacterized protein n=1 Tax=Teladorsagia circumcincta TaxID=45464 RepID=A0A2G9TXW0_TELCI|nr:hypothetical protein TELCIR_15653 [Teladorsagia circumcincta]
MDLFISEVARFANTEVMTRTMTDFHCNSVQFFVDEDPSDVTTSVQQYPVPAKKQNFKPFKPTKMIRKMANGVEKGGLLING